MQVRCLSSDRSNAPLCTATRRAVPKDKVMFTATNVAVVQAYRITLPMKRNDVARVEHILLAPCGNVNNARPSRATIATSSNMRCSILNAYLHIESFHWQTTAGNLPALLVSGIWKRLVASSFKARTTIPAQSPCIFQTTSGSGAGDRFNNETCPGGVVVSAGGTMCQLMGDFVLELNDYNTVKLYPDMNSACAAQWPDYNVTRPC